MNAWTVGQRIKQLREAAGLSQRELSIAAGVSQKAISNWEQGVSEPVLSSAVAIAKALGKDVGDLLVDPESRPASGRGRPRKRPENG